MAQVLTGARGQVKINGVVVGFIGGVNVNVDHTLTDVEIMGQLDVGDLAETAHKCSGSINLFKATEVQGTPKGVPAAGAADLNSAATIGIDTTGSDFPGMRNRAYFDIEILDDITGRVTFKMQDAKLEGGSGAMDARGIWQGTWNFKAKRGIGL